MKRSPEIEKLIRDTLAAYERGDAEFIERTTSRQPGVVAIGTDASEYAREHKAVMDLLRVDMTGASSQLHMRVGEVRAYEQGDVGWADGTGYFEKDGQSVEIRETAVFLRESGEWKTVQSHASIGVPNERMFDPLFQRQTTKT